MGDRVLIAGSRNYLRLEAVRLYIESLPPDTVVIHGAHWEGVDAAARAYATRYGMRQEPFPAAWKELGRKAGPVRNQQMLDEGKPTRVVVFRDPASKGGSTGSADMIRRTRKAGLPLVVYGPDGEIGVQE